MRASPNAPVERVTGTAAGLEDQVAVQVLSIAAATEHAHPPPAGHIPLTRNEIAALFSTLIIKPVTGARADCDSPAGGDATSIALKPATTSDKPANHEGREVRLEY